MNTSQAYAIRQGLKAGIPLQTLNARLSIAPLAFVAWVRTWIATHSQRTR